MTRKISYRVRFGVPAELGEREHMLASVESALGAIEGFDRLVANSIGLELIYKRELREIGAAFFDYEVTLFLVWPTQMQFGGSPKPSSISFVIRQIHEFLLKWLGSDSVGVNAFIDNWNKWVEKVGFSDVLIYLAPSAEQLRSLFDSFDRITHDLDVFIE